TWFQKAAMLVVPSVVGPDGSTDGAPTVVTEAFALGVPVIGTDTAGIPGIIKDGITGLLGPANSPQLLAKGIECLFEGQELRSRLAAEAHKWAAEVFDLAKNTRLVSQKISGQASFLQESISQMCIVTSESDCSV